MLGNRKEVKMKVGRRNRKLSNVSMTHRHHFSYMGLWIVLAVVQAVTVCGLLILLMEEHWAGPAAQSRLYHEAYLANRTELIAGTCIGMAVFILAVVALAMFTAHRAAGPFIRLQHVFRALQDGDLEQKLKFREYDHLEELEDGFDEMMESLKGRMTGD